MGNTTRRRLRGEIAIFALTAVVSGRLVLLSSFETNLDFYSEKDRTTRVRYQFLMKATFFPPVDVSIIIIQVAHSCFYKLLFPAASRHPLPPLPPTKNK